MSGLPIKSDGSVPFSVGADQSTVSAPSPSLGVVLGAVNINGDSGSNGFVGWVSSSTLGDNLGNHTATQTLNMNGHDIVGVDSIGGPATVDTAPNINFLTGGGILYDVTTGDRHTFNVNGTEELEVHSSGIDVNNVSYNWPSAQGAANSFLRNDGSGQLSWSTSSDNLGNHTAIQDLDMNGNEIVNVDSITGGSSGTSPVINFLTGGGILYDTAAGGGHTINQRGTTVIETLDSATSTNRGTRFRNFFDVVERSGDISPGTNTVVVYAKDVAGTTYLFVNSGDGSPQQVG